MDKNVFFRNKDIIMIGIIIMIAVILYFGIKPFIKEGENAEILLDGKVIKTLDLSRDASYSPEGMEVVFEVKDGKARFVSSDCPDKICVNTGFIDKKGQTAVCLPNRLVLRIAGGDADAVL